MSNRAKPVLRQFFLYTILFLFSPALINAQDSTAAKRVAPPVEQHDTTYVAPSVFANNYYPYNTLPNKKRVKLITAANIVGYGGTMVGLYAAWYKNYPQSNFHFFDDNSEWKQVDKVGHAYSAYIESYGSMEMWRWTGMSRRKSAVIGSLSALGYQSIIETLDGFSAEWGWSWGDMGANIFGSGLLLGQEFLWNEQRVKFKFSFHPKNYGATDLNARADKVYGSSWNERMLKDYNGQTYWLSANLKSFLPKSNLPTWLNIAAGYGADGMFGAEENVGKDDHGSIVFDRRDISRYRQYYISPDIDLTKIKTKNKLLKVALIALNAFKFPMPSLEYNSKGQVLFHILHF
ncbi:MAG TPA: DUF2279 domain-containing protein [Segetibacter sp.]